MAWVAIAITIWLALLAAILLIWRRPLLALWREPVFTTPILIVESDDWGAGPLEQAEALEAITNCLVHHHDQTGRSPVMTVALILALPEPGQATRLRQFDEPEFAPILAALRAGMERGVLAPQLHGMTHFWPPALARAAQIQPKVAAWLAAPELTENLPSHLQSRWTDASDLPSRPLSIKAIEGAVAEEVALYTRLLKTRPEVVVPPTFVWDARVEAAWAAAGVGLVMTPGRRYTGRDGKGQPSGVDRTMSNGDAGEGGTVYLVRDDYFEPILGHGSDHALKSLMRKTELGRPCLLETHRNNFLITAGGQPVQSLALLEDMLQRALVTYPSLRFCTSLELARAVRACDAAWVEAGLGRHYAIWLRRAACLPGFGKAARLTGLLSLLRFFAPSGRPLPS